MTARPLPMALIGNGNICASLGRGTRESDTLWCHELAPSDPLRDERDLFTSISSMSRSAPAFGSANYEPCAGETSIATVPGGGEAKVVHRSGAPVWRVLVPFFLAEALAATWRRRLISQQAVSICRTFSMERTGIELVTSACKAGALPAELTPLPGPLPARKSLARA